MVIAPEPNRPKMNNVTSCNSSSSSISKSMIHEYLNVMVNLTPDGATKYIRIILFFFFFFKKENSKSDPTVKRIINHNIFRKASAVTGEQEPQMYKLLQTFKVKDFESLSFPIKEPAVSKTCFSKL